MEVKKGNTKQLVEELRQAKLKISELEKKLKRYENINDIYLNNYRDFFDKRLAYLDTERGAEEEGMSTFVWIHKNFPPHVIVSIVKDGYKQIALTTLECILNWAERNNKHLNYQEYYKPLAEWDGISSD